MSHSAAVRVSRAHLCTRHTDRRRTVKIDRFIARGDFRDANLGRASISSLLVKDIASDTMRCLLADKIFQILPVVLLRKLYEPSI